MALGRIIPDEAVAAMDLDVLVEDEIQRLAAGDLRDRRFDGEFLERRERGRRRRRRAAPRDARVDQPGRPVHQALDGVCARSSRRACADRAEARRSASRTACRWAAYIAASPMAPCAPPVHIAPSLNRPKFRTLKATMWPLPISPSRSSAGTLRP